MPRSTPLLPCLAIAWSLHAHPAAAEPGLDGAKAHYQRGRAHQDAGRYDAALHEYEQAYKLAPLPALVFNLGQVYRLKGDKRSALAHYQKYLEAAPDGPAVDEARAHVTTLGLQLQLEDAESARRRAEEEARAARQREVQDLEAVKRTSLEESRRLLEEEARKQAATASELMKRIAEEQDRAFRKQEEAKREHERRLAEAQSSGIVPRVSGGVLIILGAAAALASAAAFGAGWAVLSDRGLGDPDVCAKGCAQWTSERDDALARARSAQEVVHIAWAVAAPSLVLGIALAVTGAVMRSRAIDRVNLVGAF
jgi:tetratricopeptide (TPR) repeat protein